MTDRRNEHPAFGGQSEAAKEPEVIPGLPAELRTEFLLTVRRNLLNDGVPEDQLDARVGTVDRLLEVIVSEGIPVEQAHHYARPFDVAGAPPDLMIIPQSEAHW